MIKKIQASIFFLQTRQAFIISTATVYFPIIISRNCKRFLTWKRVETWPKTNSTLSNGVSLKWSNMNNKTNRSRFKVQGSKVRVEDSLGCTTSLLIPIQYVLVSGVRFQVSGGMIKIAHNMALKNIPYLFLYVCMASGVRCQVSGFRFQVPAPLFIIPDTWNLRFWKQKVLESY